MTSPVVCVKCGDKFVLTPDKPGFANRCPDCSPRSDDKERVGGVMVWEGKHTPVLILTTRKDAREHGRSTYRRGAAPLATLAPRHGFQGGEE